VSLIRPALAGVLLLLAMACSRQAPVVQHRIYKVPRDALGRVAVMPFYPRPGLDATPSGVSAATAAELVGRFMTEAVASRGIPVIPPSDLALAFSAEGRPTPRLDGRAAASLAARDFGATSVLVGQVWRYRERSGQALGSAEPASVAFEVTLFAAPDGRRLWQARFEETQQSLTANPLRARLYPGSGTRWLTAAEFARWGASQVAKSLPNVP
jgi:hypothetical protein